MTDLLTPELEAMLKIGGALKLAREPDVKPRQKRVQSRTNNMPPEPRRATETGDSTEQVLEYPAILPAPLSVYDTFDDAYSAHEVLSDPIQPVKRGRGRPRKNPIIVRQPAGVLRRQQLHSILAGDWEIVGEVQSSDGKRSLTTSCGYKAKRVFTLRDRDSGRVVSAALGEIRAHTSLVIPKDDKEARKFAVESAFA